MARKQWLNKPAGYSSNAQSCGSGQSSDNSCARNPACTLDTASCRVTGPAPSKPIRWLPASGRAERLGSQQRNTRRARRDSAQQTRQFARRKMMDEQIGEDDIPARVVGSCQPVEHIHRHDARRPADLAQAVECLRRDQIQPVQQRDANVRPACRPPLGQAQHQRAVAGAEFEQGARAESCRAAVQRTLHDRQRRHRPVDTPQVVSGALRARIVGGEAVEQFRLDAPRQAQVHGRVRARRFTPPRAMRHGN